jgi:hypothetical protein
MTGSSYSNAFGRKNASHHEHTYSFHEACGYYTSSAILTGREMNAIVLNTLMGL